MLLFQIARFFAVSSKNPISGPIFSIEITLKAGLRIEKSLKMAPRYIFFEFFAIFLKKM
jgi:hypothetical protein